MSAVHNQLLDKLVERGFAGGDVATSPSREDDKFWPHGPSPIGVAELVDLIAKEASISKKSSRESHWIFLLGGAGNGKSFAARSLLKKLAPRFDGDRAKVPKRKYLVKSGTTSVCVVNDATIAERAEYKDRVKTALAEDILMWADQSRKSRSLSFACVNRGIILEELNSLMRVKRKGLAISEGVLKWLGGKDSSVFTTQDLSWITQSEESPIGEWYRRIRLSLGSSKARITIHALSVDVGSLFESRPNVQLNVESSSAGLPALQLSSDYKRSAATRNDSVAGNLISSLLEVSLNGAAAQRPDNCPLKANLVSLSNCDVRANWLNALRAAEIAAGRQTTYRDFWGLAALSIMGPRTVPRDAGPKHGSVTAEVDGLLSQVLEEPEPKKRIVILERLARRRLHMSIFRGEAIPLEDFQSLESSPDFPASRGLVLIDPAADVSRFAEKVEAAIEHVALDETPSEYLRKQMPELASAWQPFDSMIERVILEVINSDETSDRSRRQLLGWLSGYLLRACGCYAGGIGHERVISAWYQCWHSAGSGSPQFSSDLDIGLRTLLLPAISFQSNLEKKLTISAFASRAVPFEAAESADGKLVLTLAVNHLRLRPVRRLDRLWIELESPETKLRAHSPLDFSLLREAITCRSGLFGFTESGDETAPRLERARASMVSTGSGVAKQFGLVSGGMFKELVP